MPLCLVSTIVYQRRILNDYSLMIWWRSSLYYVEKVLCNRTKKIKEKKPISLLFNALSFIPCLFSSFQSIWMNAVNSIRWILNRYVHFIVRMFSLHEFIIDASHMNSGQTTTGGNRKMNTNQIKFILVNRYVAIKTFLSYNLWHNLSTQFSKESMKVFLGSRTIIFCSKSGTFCIIWKSYSKFNWFACLSVY